MSIPAKPEGERKKWTLNMLQDKMESQKNAAKAKSEQLDTTNLIQLGLFEQQGDAEKLKNPKARHFKDFFSQERTTFEEEISAFQNSKNIELSTSSSQCLKYPLSQPQHKAKCYPIPLTFIAKKARKCPKCKKFVIKPDPTNQTHEFKMSSFFHDFSPQLRIRTLDTDENQKPTILHMNLHNLTKHKLVLTIEIFDLQLHQDFRLEQQQQLIQVLNGANIELHSRFSLDSLNKAAVQGQQAGTQAVAKKASSHTFQIKMPEWSETGPQPYRLEDEVSFMLLVTVNCENDGEPIDYKFLSLVEIGRLARQNRPSLSSAQQQQQQQQPPPAQLQQQQQQ